jgi:hypothetical protein
MMPIDMALATALTKMKPKAARLRPAEGAGTASRMAGPSDMRRLITPRADHVAYLRAERKCMRIFIR